jgi:hypothetical protein
MTADEAPQAHPYDESFLRELRSSTADVELEWLEVVVPAVRRIADAVTTDIRQPSACTARTTISGAVAETVSRINGIDVRGLIIPCTADPHPPVGHSGPVPGLGVHLWE